MLRPRLMLLDEPSLGLAPDDHPRGLPDHRAKSEEDGATMLLVEQNAGVVLGSPTARTCSGRAASWSAARPSRFAGTRGSDARTGVVAMSGLVERVISGSRGLDLRGPRPRAGPHLPVDRHHELRPGRDRDVQHVHRLEVRPGRSAVRGGGPRHAGRSFVGGMAIERVLIRPVEGGTADDPDRDARPVHPRQRRWRGWIWGSLNRGFPRALSGGAVALGIRAGLGVARASWPCCSGGRRAVRWCSSTRSSGWRCGRRRSDPGSRHG